MDLIQGFKGKSKEKFDYLLDERLLDATCSIGVINVDGATETLAELYNSPRPFSSGS